MHVLLPVYVCVYVGKASLQPAQVATDLKNEITVSADFFKAVGVCLFGRLLSI